jgi:heme exporter protein A
VGAHTPAILVERVTKRFGHLVALNGVDLRVDEGGSVALLGPNGAGKTTLLRLISTLGRPSSGAVRIRGIDTQSDPEAVRAQIGLISHQTLLYEDLTAEENLRFYGRLYGLSGLPERVQEALDRVGLTGREGDRVRGFSRGMKQRLAIARATLHEPTILLLDEPFTGLDAAAQAMLSGMIRDLRAAGRTVLLVTHDIGQGHALCDEYAILSRGRVRARGNTAEIDGEGLKAEYTRKTQDGPRSRVPGRPSRQGQ